nr:TPA_exp: ArzL - PKS (FAAL, ACP) [Fischerella sp. PCC 9339]
MNKWSTLVDLLRYRAQSQPNRRIYTFLQDGETESDSLTNWELDQQARALAAHLQSLDLAGERALLIYPPGLEFITAFLGCLYASVIAVPAYPHLRRKQHISKLKGIVADTHVKVALTSTSLLATIEGQFAQNAELASLQCLSTDKIASKLVSDWRKPEISSETLAFLQYTSGSTGSPKGVMVSHGNILHNSEIIYTCFGHTDDSHVVSWLPPYHDMGLIGGILQPLYGGFPVTLMSPETFIQKPFCWLQQISRYKATTSGGPNFAYDLCVHKIKPEQLASLDLSSWTLAFTGAEPVRAETMKQFAAAFEPYGFQWESFYPCYGMAEGTLIVSGGLKASPPVIYFVEGAALEQNRVIASVAEGKSVRAIVGCGRSWLDQKIVIANPESLTQCPEGQVGEIWVLGSSVTQGYWNRHKETQQTFKAYLAGTGEGPFLRTGDLGFLQDGELFVTGRIKDVIIIRGRNYYPQDIELSIQKIHPSLRPNYGAAFSVEIEDQERLMVAQEVERTCIREINVDEVVEAIRRAVSEQHGLQVYGVLLLKPGSIPKTSSGKIQRYACRVSFLDKSLDIVGDWIGDPRQIDLLQLQTEIDALWEQVQNSTKQLLSKKLKSANQKQRIDILITYLTEIVVRVLRLNENNLPNPKKGFFDMGMDSLMAVELGNRLQSDLGISFSATTVFEYSNIEELAFHLDKVIPLDVERQKSQSTQQKDRPNEISLKQVSQLSENELQSSIEEELTQLETALQEIGDGQQGLWKWKSTINTATSSAST